MKFTIIVSISLKLKSKFKIRVNTYILQTILLSQQNEQGHRIIISLEVNKITITIEDTFFLTKMEQTLNFCYILVSHSKVLLRSNYIIDSENQNKYDKFYKLI